MDGTDTIAEDVAAEDADIRADWVAGQLCDLAELRALTMGMARRVAQMQAELCATPSPEAVKDCATLTLCMTRITRSVRQLVALEQEAAGLRDPQSMAAWRKRNTDSARALRAAVAAGVGERLPGRDKQRLKGLMADLFRDYDDYDDYQRGDVGPLVHLIAERLADHLDLPPEIALDKAFYEEVDRVIDFRNAHGRLPTTADPGFENSPIIGSPVGSYGHDPP